MASKEQVVAVDTEFLRERTYYPRLCLIQLGTAGASAAIDPLAIRDLSPLVDLLTNRGIVKVFHACTQDLEVIQAALGCVVAPVFDTQLAAAFLGQRQQLGYGALVEAYCGVRLPKAESLTDWSRRPLDKEQLQYAEDDVRYLPGIYQTMTDALRRSRREGWLGPEMAQLTDPSRFTRSPDQAYLHLKRANSLTRRQLSIARELCAWRERTAAQRDIPKKWVLSDEVVLEACKRAPRAAERLRRIRGAEQMGERDAQEAIAAIRRGLDCEPALYPERLNHERPSGETEGVLDLMYALLRIVAEKNGIAAQLIATKDDLLEFVTMRSASRLARSAWRYELVGRQLDGLLDGQIGLTVKDGRIELL